MSSNTVDGALAGSNTGFFADKGIIKINAILMLALVSMMNGLQSLDEWKSYFHNPPQALWHCKYVNSALSTSKTDFLLD